MSQVAIRGSSTCSRFVALTPAASWILLPLQPRLLRRAIIKFILDARTATPHFPGIGRYVSSLSTALADQLGPDESLALLTNDPIKPAAAGRITHVPAAASPFSIRQQRLLPPILRDYAVYHSPYYLMPYRPGVPTVLTIYDLIPLLFPDHVSGRARLMFRLATRLALQTADRVICISAATRTDLLAHFRRRDPKSVAVIPLAPAAHFQPQSTARIQEVRTAYGLPDRFALYIGINKPHKNLARLIAAWQLLEDDIPLVIGGAWDERYPGIRELAANQSPGRIRFIGRIPDEDLPALYAACRVFVFPSLYEGFGLPVVEAMACGATVACSQTSSLPEVGGDAAVYFDPADPAAIAQAVQTAIRRPKSPDTMISQAQNFTWRAAAAETLAIYRSLAGTD